MLTACLTGCLTGCVTAPASDADALRFTQPIVLLGEVHDNAAQHALRLQAFARWLASGARPALLLEQFDADRQPAIDAARAAAPALDADALIAAATGTLAGNSAGAMAGGWNWDHYRPFIALALQHGLPIVAANLPREQARAVMRDGLAAGGFDAAVPPALLQTQADAIQASHCGMVDTATAGRMALAQVGRDQLMARIVAAHAAGADASVLLLAGNGHVRADIGVPHWLMPGVRVRTLVVGYLEDGDDSAAAFDRVVLTAKQQRADPCAGMQSPKSIP